MPLRRITRALASLLAVVALSSAAARPVMACEMGTPAAPNAEVPVHDVHAHHGMPAQDSQSKRGPQAPACDHLVGCAVMVVASAPTVTVVPVTVPEAAPRWVAAHLDAPVMALEPPPPRA